MIYEREDQFLSYGLSFIANFMLFTLMAAMSFQPKPVELQMDPVPISIMSLPQEEEKAVEEEKEEEPPPPPPEEIPADKPEDIPKEEPKEEPKEPTPPPPPKAVPLHKLTTMPGFARRVEPVYPESLRVAGIQGQVLVEVYISAQGAIMQINVLKSDNEEFSEAVKRAIMSSSFITGRQDGKPVPVKVQIPFTFKLN
ncbi:MAG: energy transducer TonB [Nitrospinota bacterium]|nr:energy transducer TonB [Nitrospinota bacterium]